MRQVEYVSIGGYVFSLEDDASRVANEYLDQLGSFYSGKESGIEVMEGIEERMAELLLEKSGPGRVVTMRMVEDVISVLGRPEAIENESSETSGAASDYTSDASESGSSFAGENAGAADRSSRKSSKAGEKPRRKLYRDPSNGKFAGVCSGLATYFNLDPALFRILFVVLTLLGLLPLSWRIFWPFEPWIHFSAPIVYAVLWICMPAVKTVRQRDEMRGERGTVEGIRDRILNTQREESKVPDSQTWNNVKRILSITLGVIFLLSAVAGISFLCSFWWGGEILGNSFFYNRLIEEMASEAPELLSFISAPLVMIAAVLVAIIPLFALLYGGVMLIFGLKSPKWHPALILLVIWLIILVALTVSFLMTFAVID